MIENTQGIQPELPPVHEAALKKLQIVAGEYFDDYLIVVSKGNERWRCYKSEDGAYGKAAFIINEISRNNFK